MNRTILKPKPKSQARVDAGYLRYSSHAQDQGVSVELQQEAICRAAGHTDIRWYIDRARTGRAVAGREQLHQLLLDAPRIGRVFTYKYDRLGRNEADSFATVEELQDAGCEVISCTEGADAITRGIHLVMAAHYSRELATRTRDGQVQRFKQRAWVGGNPVYGFTLVRDGAVTRLARHPHESQVVAELFAAYLNTATGFKELARAMQAKGYPTRRGAPWCLTTVRSILTNPMHTGLVSFNRRRFKLNKATGTRIPEPNDQDVVESYRDESLRIIPDDTFEAVQAKIAERGARTTRPRAASAIRAFTGHLFCDCCRAAFYSRKSENAKGLYIYYQCGSRQRRGPRACANAATLREDLLLTDLKEAIRQVVVDSKELVAKATDLARREVALFDSRSALIEDDLKRVTDEVGRLTRALIDPMVVDAAKPILSQQLAEAGAKQADLRAKLLAMGKRANRDHERLADKVEQALELVLGRVEGVSSPAELNRLVEDVVGPSVVTAEGRLLPLETEPPSAGAEGGVPVNIAGGGFEPPTSGL